MGPATTLTELGAARFVMAVDKILAVYTAAMNPAPSQVAGRRAIMARHATNPGFRALAVLDDDGEPVAFSYGFHGDPGQWWHDMVNYALSAAAGEAEARHVRPERVLQQTVGGVDRKQSGGDAPPGVEVAEKEALKSCAP